MLLNIYQQYKHMVNMDVQVIRKKVGLMRPSLGPNIQQINDSELDILSYTFRVLHVERYMLSVTCRALRVERYILGVTF